MICEGMAIGVDANVLLFAAEICILSKASQNFGAIDERNRNPECCPGELLECFVGYSSSGLQIWYFTKTRLFDGIIISKFDLL